MYGNGKADTPVGRNGRVTVRTLQKMKDVGSPIAMVTAYDATFGRLVEAAGVHVVLVGDSLGMVIQGHDTTLPVTLEEVIYHCKAVVRGTGRVQVVGDLPFMSYQATQEDGLRSAGRLMKEGGVGAVKLEGGEEVAPLVKRVVDAGIPVMGHIGLTPQSVHQLGGYRIQGRAEADAERLRSSARALEEAGAYALVMESVPWRLAQEITESLTIPTIGIGAGKGCSGQVLVIYDLLGMDERFNPKFLKKYGNLSASIVEAVSAYVEEVQTGSFPDEDHSFQ